MAQLVSGKTHGESEQVYPINHLNISSVKTPYECIKGPLDNHPALTACLIHTMIEIKENVPLPTKQIDTRAVTTVRLVHDIG